MEDNLHPLTKLLLARMESHPEEFENGIAARDKYTSNPKSHRWYHAVEAVTDHGTEADKAALNAALGKLFMNEAHEWAMDELLNGEDRRKQAQVEAEAMKLKQYALQKANQYAQLHQANQYAYANNTGIASTMGLANQGTLTSAAPKEWTDQALASVKKALGLE